MGDPPQKEYSYFTRFARTEFHLRRGSPVGGGTVIIYDVGGGRAGLRAGGNQKAPAVRRRFFKQSLYFKRTFEYHNGAAGQRNAFIAVIDREISAGRILHSCRNTYAGCHETMLLVLG